MILPLYRMFGRNGARKGPHHAPMHWTGLGIDPGGERRGAGKINGGS